jgi:hypothetical protein
MSPSMVSWRRGNKRAKLDHIITWNLPPDSNAGSLGACWRSVGTKIPEGCKKLDHPALAQRLARTTTLRQHELLLLLPQGLTAQSVVRVGEQVFRPRVQEQNGPPSRRAEHRQMALSPALLLLLLTVGRCAGSPVAAHGARVAAPLELRGGSAAGITAPISGVKVLTLSSGPPRSGRPRSRCQRCGSTTLQSFTTGTTASATLAMRTSERIT